MAERSCMRNSALSSLSVLFSGRSLPIKSNRKRQRHCNRVNAEIAVTADSAANVDVDLLSEDEAGKGEDSAVKLQEGLQGFINFLQQFMQKTRPARKPGSMDRTMSQEPYQGHDSWSLFQRPVPSDRWVLVP